jgi:hypothetical protein
MDFSAINKIMQSENLSYDLVDEYVERGIFYRGYIFICENCSDAAWHSISEVGQIWATRPHLFTCGYLATCCRLAAPLN